MWYWVHRGMQAWFEPCTSKMEDNWLTSYATIEFFRFHIFPWRRCLGWRQDMCGRGGWLKAYGFLHTYSRDLGICIWEPTWDPRDFVEMMLKMMADFWWERERWERSQQVVKSMVKKVYPFNGDEVSNFFKSYNAKMDWEDVNEAMRLTYVWRKSNHGHRPPLLCCSQPPP